MYIYVYMYIYMYIFTHIHIVHTTSADSNTKRQKVGCPSTSGYGRSQTAAGTWGGWGSGLSLQIGRGSRVCGSTHSRKEVREGLGGDAEQTGREHVLRGGE